MATPIIDPEELVCSQVHLPGLSNQESLEDLPTPASSISSPPSEVAEKHKELPLSFSSITKPRLGTELYELFTENVIAKIYRVAVRELEKDPSLANYPEYITNTGHYTLREADFWTCGFFPGSLYALLERAMRYPQFLPIPVSLRPTFHTSLLKLCRAWSVPIRAMATRTDTHDMGFIILPALKMDWELTGNEKSLGCVVKAAESLASRWDEGVSAIRSWDQAVNHRYQYTDMERDFLVIIDSMCNLDLLYWVGHQMGNQNLIDTATKHAHTVLKAIVRDDWSTYHLINFDAQTGAIKNKLTNQGYRDSSTWSRGQAWAVMGFAQTYSWSHDPVFLDAAINISKYFLGRLRESEGKRQCPFVPLWDFDAPESTNPPRDTSAGVIAANGFLLLHQLLISERRDEEAAEFLDSAVRIMRETIESSMSEEKVAFEEPAEESTVPVVKEGAEGVHFDGILLHATANNNEDSYKRYADHGLVYADYYFLELGNKLMRMGLV